MHFDFKGNCYIADSRADFDGARILVSERFKPGVRRVHCVFGNDFRVVYTNEDFVRPSGMSQSHYRKVSRLPNSAKC